MKFWKCLAALVILLLCSHQAQAYKWGSATAVAVANSELVLNATWAGTEWHFINLMMGAADWNCGNNTCGGASVPGQGHLTPDQLDSNGYPKFGGTWSTNNGAVTNLLTPSQASRPGHYVLAWTGGRQFQLIGSYQAGGGVLATVSCTGTAGGAGAPNCSNTGCSSFTGSTSGTTLTVTAAPTGTGCTLGPGIPISNASLKISTFGTPTIITSSGSACGGNTCYTINQSQTVTSGTMFMGGRFEVSVTTENTTGAAQYGIIELSSNNDSQTSNMAFYHVGDESAWEASATPCGGGKACLVGTLFKTRIKQGNFAVLRDLDFENGNASNCSTWSSRKPLTYFSYAADEFRNATSGTDSGGYPNPGQYVNSGGTGASGGTVSISSTTTASGFSASISGSTLTVTGTVTGTIGYNNTVSGTGVATDTIIIGNAANNSGACSPACTGAGGTGTYALRNSQTVGSESMTTVHNDFTVTLGSGAPVDRQTFIMVPPASGDPTSVIKFNGNTISILTSEGLPIALNTGFGGGIPSYNIISTLTYDAVLGGFLNFGGSVNTGGSTNNYGLLCMAPPEAFMELNAELGTTPWHVGIALALDPMTDWIKQYATYWKNNYSSSLPIRFEALNEPWNFNSLCFYLSAKTTVYINSDGWSSGYFCGSTGNVYSEVGKMASTMGQDLTTVLGSGNFELLVPVQTGYGVTGGQIANDALQSSAYINQTNAVQPGYTKTAAYKYATRVSVNNYWNAGYYSSGSSVGAGPEVGIAYCFFNYSISTPCQGLYASQAAAMSAYMATSTVNLGSGANNIYSTVNIFLSQWDLYGSLCGNYPSARPAGCTVNTNPLMYYEGGYNEAGQSSDVTQGVSSATDASQAVLSITNNGCVQGQTINLSSLSGGTWSTAAGNYTVQSATTNTCTINLNSTGLGTLSSATITYTGSANYVTYLRVMSYTSSDLQSLTTTMYNDTITAGGASPSQYHLAGCCISGGNPWFVFSYDIYGYFQEAQCTSCTISGTTLTLGGTVTGIFANGQALIGGSIPSGVTLSGCTKVGSGPCGSNSSDTFTVSQSLTISSGETMTGNAVPQTVGANTTSPITAFKAICTWNGNGGAC